MSWIKSAVNKAVEAGGNGNLTRIRKYADSVVQQAGNAVVEGAKILQDRIAARNVRSFKIAVKRLEELSVSCRGAERVQLLRRWLVALKEVEKLTGDSLVRRGKSSGSGLISAESLDSPKKPTMVLYYDADLGGEPANFLTVFLHSQALEGMILSMILEAPNEEEVSLLREIFGICLAGGKNVLKEAISSIQNLAKAFSSYEEEVLVKREELLLYAQRAIAGLKLNADIQRIDSEVSSILTSLDQLNSRKPSSVQGHDEYTVSQAEALKDDLTQVKLRSRLEELLLKKKLLNNGDSPDIHAQKVDKLKVLSESLANSASQAEKRISEHRLQKEDALKFRVTKTREVFQIEKELNTDIGELERQRDELEEKLNKVNTSLAAARVRLHNAREEREQFDEASNQILAHLIKKENDLSRSIACYKAEACVCDTFVDFMQNAWKYQSQLTEKKETLVNDELRRYRDHFVNLSVKLMSSYKDDLESSITTFRVLVDHLNSTRRSELASCPDDEIPLARKNLEYEYLESEAKFMLTFSIVDTIKYHFFSLYGDNYRNNNNDQRIKELLGDLEKIKDEFESIKRPILEIENPTRVSDNSSKGRPKKSVFLEPKLRLNDEYGHGKNLVLEARSKIQREEETPLLNASEERTDIEMKVIALGQKAESSPRRSSMSRDENWYETAPIPPEYTEAQCASPTESTVTKGEKSSEPSNPKPEVMKDDEARVKEEIDGWDFAEFEKELL